MALLVAKINKLCSKLENFQSSEALSASLEAFLSDVSNGLSKLSTSGSETIMSFSWIQQCFELISMTNKAFAKLIVAIDHPLSKWGASSVEEYLSYTFNLLELFNSITASLSHLRQARLLLSYGLRLEENSPDLALKYLKAIQPMSLKKEFRRRERERREKGSCSSKEEVIHKAVMVMESLGFWVCGVVLSCLCGGDNSKEYGEMRKFGGGFWEASFGELDSSAFELKEVEEVNDSVACLEAAIIGNGERSGEAEEFSRRLEVLEKVLEGFENEVDSLFHEVLRGRNLLLNGFQQRTE